MTNLLDLTNAPDKGAIAQTNFERLDTLFNGVGIPVPIGAILPWHKTLAGTPALTANFVECNGQTIADAASPYNGLAVPNLNTNNQFLRGAAASGGTGGAAAHTHTFAADTDVEDGDINVEATISNPTTVAGAGHTHPVSGVTGSTANLPPYTEMVWIIRIK